MRNLKKSLAMLLALVMVFGLCTIGAGATATGSYFKDDADIGAAYQTAVKVMSGFGILVGSDEDGDGQYEFNPTANVTRAQAAKMIAYMMLGEAAAEKLPIKSSFKDVKITDWEAKFVNYLSNAGIINGYGDGNFGPDDSVTATQLAKMLLGAAGYGKADEFVGEGWDVNVFVYAVDLGIYEDTEASDYEAAASRQEAALYVYNAMNKVTLVKYSADNGYSFKVNANTTFAATKYNLGTLKGIITANQDTGEAYMVLTVGNINYKLNIDVPEGMIGHQAEVFYNTSAETDDDSVSYFNVYAVNDLSKEVNAYFSTYKALYEALGGKYMNYSADFIYWMDSVNTPASAASITGVYTAAALKANPSTYFMNNGSFVLDENGSIIGYKTTSFYVTRVSKIVTTAGSESITLADDPANAASLTLSNTAENDEVVEYDGIAKGDLVNVVIVGDMYKLIKCTVAEDVYVSSIGTASKAINGTYFDDTSKNFTSDLGDALVLGGTYDIYLDMRGYYVYADLVEAGKEATVFLTLLYTKAGTGTYGSATTSYYAQCVDTAGVEQNYLLTQAEYNSLTAGKLYEVSSSVVSGVTYYNLTLVDGTATSTKLTYTAKFSSFNGAAGNYYLNSDCKYIYVDGTGADLDVTVANSQPNDSATYNVFFAPVQVGTTNNYTVSYVFVASAAPATVGTSYIYSTRYDTASFLTWSYISSTSINSKGGTDYILSAYLDGAFSTFKLSSIDASLFEVLNGTNYLKLGFYAFTVDADGYYTLTPFTAAAGYYNPVNSEAITNIYNGAISTETTITDLPVGSAKFVDLTSNNIASLDDIQSLIDDGKTVKVSMVAYVNAATATSSVGTIYVTSVQ
jgi:hypothetical protein